MVNKTATIIHFEAMYIQRLKQNSKIVHDVKINDTYSYY